MNLTPVEYQVLSFVYASRSIRVVSRTDIYNHFKNANIRRSMPDLVSFLIENKLLRYETHDDSPVIITYLGIHELGVWEEARKTTWKRIGKGAFVWFMGIASAVAAPLIVEWITAVLKVTPQG